MAGARSAAEEAVAKLQAETAAECETIKQEAAARLDQAVELIIEKVVKAYGGR